MQDFFQESDVFSTYSLADAIADGSIICLSDKPEHVKDVKQFFKCPVYITSSVYQAHKDAAELCYPNNPDDAKKLLSLSIFDMLNMSRMCSKELSPTTIKFVYHLQNTKDTFSEKLTENIAVSGPDDHGDLIVTFMNPSEN